MKWLERTARYLLAAWFTIGAVDGWLYLFFDIQIHGDPQGVFLTAIISSTWFYAFMKLIQTVGAISLLTNFKPALGLALLTPVTAVLCLYYFYVSITYKVVAFSPIGMILIISTAILFHAYSKSFRPLLDDYRF